MKWTILFISALLLLLAACNGSKYDTFAQCLSDKNVKFYGAFWCPHCAHQKELLDYSEMIPYVECSLADQSGQTEVCIQANITNYPTWEFSFGDRMTGVIAPQELSNKTSCPLP